MKKKILSLVLCAALVLGMTACGSSEKEKKSDSSTEEVVLEFPSWQATEPGFQEFWEEAVAEFEKRHENVKINLYQVPFDSYVDTLTTLYAAGTAPQITHIPSRYFAQFSDMGWFEPLNDRRKQRFCRTGAAFRTDFRQTGNITGFFCWEMVIPCIITKPCSMRRELKFRLTPAPLWKRQKP